MLVERRSESRFCEDNVRHTRELPVRYRMALEQRERIEAVAARD
jgi:hypothetical protein